MHRDIVYNYPEGCEELGSTNVCRVQGMYMPKRLITVQGKCPFFYLILFLPPLRRLKPSDSIIGHPEFNQE